ncbi:hypothetical protein PsorP6_009822 [Peronosclerospora sorghi]|uniref:Uncharacterized protein n=1 Tax=Peronosclerospora sorghi TaxID=230839 RepID=A0ACC0W0X5_9STRA|nr:hypothetical protein PsorP6_009822 [Peronosclerospora sorghi]
MSEASASAACDAEAARPLGPTKGSTWLSPSRRNVCFVLCIRLSTLFGLVTLQFVAVGNAPLLKRTKFTVSGHDPLSVVYKFLRKQLRLQDSESLFVYCNSSFAPCPDQRLSSLFEVRFCCLRTYMGKRTTRLLTRVCVMVEDQSQCFQVGNVLVLNYSLTQAWG